MSMLDRRKKQRRKGAEQPKPGTVAVLPVASVVKENGKRKLIFEMPLFTQMGAISRAILNRFKRVK